VGGKNQVQWVGGKKGVNMYRAMSYEKMVVLTASLIFFSFLQAFCSQYTQYAHVVLDDYFNAPHTTYFKTFFTSEIVTIDGIPFEIRLSGNNTIMTPLQGPGVVTIPIRRTPSNIYILGFGTFISRDFGHKDLYCDSIDHFSITLGYVDGTREEKFPIDARLGFPQWSDILRAEGAVAHFEGGYIHMYKVPVGGKELEYISINDKYGGLASYWIIAITLEYVEEQVPSRTQTLLQWTLDPSVLEANKLTVVKIDGYLRRADTNAGLADKPITIELPGVPRIELRTDGSGYFGLRHGLQLPEGTYRVTISFPGDALFQPVTDSRELRVYRPRTHGSLAVFDLDYKGTPPNSDGNNQTFVTVAPGTTLTIFFRYNEGNAGNQYVIRAYGEWDKNRFLANSDNDEQVAEVGAEIEGYRWDKEAYTVPNAPGTYKVRVVYNASAIPPTWDTYDRLLAEGTVIVTQPQVKVKTTLEWTLEPSLLEPNKLTTIKIDGYLRRADTHTGVPGKKIYIQLPGEPLIDVPTDQTGHFGLVYGVRLAEGTYQVRVFFPGDDSFLPTEDSRELRVSRQYNINISVLDVFSSVVNSIFGDIGDIMVLLSISGLPGTLTGSIYITVNGEQIISRASFSNGIHVFDNELALANWSSLNISIDKVVFDDIGVSVPLHWRGVWDKTTIAQIIDQAWDYVKRFPDVFKQENGKAIPKPTNINYPAGDTEYMGPLDEIRVRSFDVANYRAILHELGHYIEDKWYLFNMDQEYHGEHTPCDKRGPKFAFKEGWAEFFANLVIHEHFKKPYLASFNLEDPFQHCPNFHSSSDNDQWALGVAAILWDLYDGYNEDFDRISIPISTLLMIIKESMSSSSKGVYTLYWNLRKYGYPQDKIRALFKAYGLDYEPSSPFLPVGHIFSTDFDSLEGWQVSGLWRSGSETCLACVLLDGAFAYYARPEGCTYEVKDRRGRSVRTSGTLTSPVISIPKNTALTLQFDFFREVESYTRSTLDRTYVQIRLGTSGKTVRWGSWETIWSRSSKDPSPECNTASYTFQSKNYDRLQIRFVFDSVNGNNNNYRGWAIDNLVVKPAPTSPAALELADLGEGWDVPDEFEPGEMKVLNIPNPVTDVHTTVFTVLGVEAEEIRVEVYDLTGRLVWEGEGRGNELPWDTRDVTGLPLANGVYLYLVYVKVEGEWIVSDVQKLVILR